MITIFAALLFLVSVFFTLSLFRKRIFNPLLGYTFMYLLALICYELGINRGILFIHLSSYAELLLAASLIFFSLGALSIALVNRDKKSPHTVLITEIKIELIYKIAIYAIMLLIIAVCYKWFVLFQQYGNPFTNIIAIRADYVKGDLQFGLANIIAYTCGNLASINLGVMIVIRSNRAMLLRLTIVTIVFSILNNMAIGGGNMAFYTATLLLTTVLVTYESFSKKITSKQAFNVFLVIAIFAFIVFVLFYWRSEGSSLNKGILNIFLLYIGGDISSFSFFIDHPIPSFPAGRHVFGGIYYILNDLFGIFGGSSFMPELNPADYIADITEISFAFNTSIHLSYYYADFGALGIIVLSCLLGIISTYFFFKAVNQRRIMDIQLAAFFLHTIFMSIRGVASEGRYFWLILFILFLQHHYPFKRKRQVTVATAKQRAI